LILFTSASRVIGWKDRSLHQSSDWLGRSSPKVPVICWAVH